METRSSSTRSACRGVGRLLIAGTVLASVGLMPTQADARINYGPVTISGNLESQNILRAQEIDDWQFIQQRNTLRLEYEHDLVNARTQRLLDSIDVPFLRSAKFFTYYRLVYDSIYDIAPGGFMKATDGSRIQPISAIRSSVRDDVAWENNIRELYVDLQFSDIPLSFRIGKQQIVWGNANLNQRGLDSVNALDLSWHWSQEAGLLGRVGFTELRRTAWTIKMNYNIGNIGPLANVFLEAYDIPADFKQTFLRFGPYPWGFPGRNPFRGGQAIPVAEGVFVEPCFDFTGNSAPNSEADVDFSNASQTGACPTRGLKRSRLTEGIYDPNDPFDVNQFGARIGAMAPYGINFTLAYMYRRSIIDVAGTASAKQPAAAAIDADPVPYIQPSLHSSFDPQTGQVRDYIGYIRIPFEFYHPYVHVFGGTVDFFDSWLTSAVWNLEMAWTHNNPIFSRDVVADPNAVRKTDMVIAAVSMDRPTWMTWLKKGRTVSIQSQLNVGWQPFHEEIRLNDAGEVVSGFVGTPFSTSIPGQFRDEVSFDRLKDLTLLHILVMNTTYWGGSLIPVIGLVSDYTNAPTLEALGVLQYLYNPWTIFEIQGRFFWTNGHTVDDRFSIGRMTRRNEIVLKATYQF